MLLTYQYQCPGCLAVVCEVRDVEDRNALKPCPCGGTLQRQYTPPLFTAWLAKDEPANKIYHGDREDVRRQQKADDIAYEKATEGFDTSKHKETTVDDILETTGVVQAYRSGNEALRQWREDYCPSTEEPANA